MSALARLLGRLLALLLRCRHQRQSWVFGKTEAEHYTRCLDCGQSLPYSWQEMKRRRSA